MRCSTMRRRTRGKTGWAGPGLPFPDAAVYLAVPRILPRPAPLPLPTELAVDALRACVRCGALNATRFCGDCGAAVGAAPESATQILREGVAELVGVDMGVLRTLRDLVLRPVAVVRSYWAGNPAGYERPFRLFFTLAGVYMLMLTWLKPFEFDWEQTVRTLRPAGRKVVEQLMADHGVTAAVVGARYENWMNSLTPILAAVMLVPLAWMLRRMNRSQPFANHLLFAASITNSMWIICIALTPVAHFNSMLFAAIAQVTGCTFYGFGVFGLYPGPTRTRTALRLAGFLAADMVVTGILSMMLAVCVLFAAMMI
jgi:hypothetical protein